jgi:hypothetical protein
VHRTGQAAFSDQAFHGQAVAPIVLPFRRRSDERPECLGLVLSDLREQLHGMMLVLPAHECRHHQKKRPARGESVLLREPFAQRRAVRRRLKSPEVDRKRNAPQVEAPGLHQATCDLFADARRDDDGVGAPLPGRRIGSEGGVRERPVIEEHARRMRLELPVERADLQIDLAVIADFERRLRESWGTSLRTRSFTHGL